MKVISIIRLLSILAVILFVFNPGAVYASKNLGFWYGTNNTADYRPANGSGGSFEYRNWNSTTSYTEVSSGYVGDFYEGTRYFRVNPDNDFQTGFVRYAVCTEWDSYWSFGGWRDYCKTHGAWSDVTLPSNPADTFTFSLQVGPNSYVFWTNFTAVTSSYTVTGTVSSATDAACTSNTISPESRVVSSGSTASFSLSTSSNCVVDSVNFNGTGFSTTGISGNTYTTPAITGGDKNFEVKFRPVGYTITATVNAASPSGSGSISPGTTSVAQGGSQTFTITPNSGYAISHVMVTDTRVPYNNVDLAPLVPPNYTFTNVQANGSIDVTFTAVTPTSGDSYCQIPPFVQGQTNLKPNILIIFDNSGSMGGSDSDGYAYYNRKTYDCDGTNNSTCTRFYGYFDTEKMYKVDSGDSNKYLINNVTLNLTSTNGKSGNYLNWRNMHKVDIVRKAFMGGKIEDRSATTKYLVSDNGKKIEYGTALPEGIVQQMASKVRFGMMVFRSNSEGARLATVPGTTRKTVLGADVDDLVKTMESSETDPATNTPLAEALYEALRYYQAKPSAYNDGVDYGTMDPVQYNCQKHFIMLLTDGEPNNNNNLPGLSTYPTKNGYTDTDFNIVTWENRIPSGDRASVSTSTCSGVSFSSSTNTQKVEAVAFYGHNENMRKSSLNYKAGNHNVTFFTVYAFGDGSGTKTLQMAAKYGGYKNTDGNAPSPNTYPSPNLQSEWNKTTGSCIPKNYYEADDGQVLEDGIRNAFKEALAAVASGTASSILSNSEGSGANLLQAVFFPSKIFSAGNNTAEISWTGEMQNLWYYVDPFSSNSSVREDTDFVSTTPYKVFNIKNDYVADFKFIDNETVVNLSQDTNGDGLGDANPTTVSTDDVKSLWKAGRQLWAKSADSRTIHTSIDGLTLLASGSPADSKGGFYTDTTRATALKSYLQAADVAEAQKIIGYARGTEQVNYRNRTVYLLTGTDTYTPGVWKLGDIVSSTPKLQSTNRQNSYNLIAPSGYSDKSYAKFVGTTNYKNRGMVYVGANDGMLHAFKLGKLTVSGTSDALKPDSTNYTIAGDIKATLTGTNLGEEQWAYMPRNALPYLKYFTDKDNYKHLYYVDGPITVVDVAVGKTSGCASGTDYSECIKDEDGGTNWKSVLIGSMGLGGASRLKDTATCTDGVSGTCVKTPIFDPTDTGTPKTLGIGYSSYFALDVTGQYFNSDGTLANQPTLKWEFARPDLGYSTSGAAIVRIAAKDADGKPDKTKNGKWYAVFASGPTGPIDTAVHTFLGKSDQNLKIFVVDLGATAPLVENTNYWVLDTGIQRAFGGSMLPGVIDTDRWNKLADGNYQDDAIYVGYTKANISDTDPITSGTTWTDGGVIRILTKEDTNPANWTTSKVISGIGPVTSGIVKLQDRKTNYKNLWLYFGTGRFYYGGDDPTNVRYLMGVKEGCYRADDTIDPNCDTTASGVGKPIVLATDLADQTTTVSSMTGKKGWYVKLPGQITSSNLSAQRVITEPVAISSGMVLFTSFGPTSDICSYGGTSYQWAFKYDSGSLPLCASLKGKILIQMSTGSFEQQNLSDIFECNAAPVSSTGDTTTVIRKRPPSPPTPPTPPDGGSYNAPPSPPLTGKPPADPPTYIYPGGNTPMKKVIHIQEK